VNRGGLEIGGGRSISKLGALKCRSRPVGETGDKDTSRWEKWEYLEERSGDLIFHNGPFRWSSRALAERTDQRKCLQ